MARAQCWRSVEAGARPPGKTASLVERLRPGGVCSVLVQEKEAGFEVQGGIFEQLSFMWLERHLRTTFFHVFGAASSSYFPSCGWRTCHVDFQRRCDLKDLSWLHYFDLRVRFWF